MPSARRMVFTCGVRFMRRRSAGDSGRLSRSELAAASICCCVIGRRRRVVFDEIVILLMPCCPARRYDPDAAIPFGVNDRQHRALRDADQDETVLAIILAIVGPLDDKRILEPFGWRLEADAVLSIVLGRLCFIPFERHH
jgi:hypothetical protein